MKAFFHNDILDIKSELNFEKYKEDLINSNNFINYINTNISIPNYFFNLDEKRIIEINIIKSKTSLKEANNDKTFQENIIFSEIKEIIKKYENHPLISINQLINKSIIPTPLFDTEQEFYQNHKTIPYSYPFQFNLLQNLLNIKNNNNNNNFSNPIYQNPVLSELFKNRQENLTNDSNNDFNYLKHKRKTPFIEPEKNLTKYKVVVTTNKESDDDEIYSDINSQKKFLFKKAIFKLDKKLKNGNDIKIKKNPGRKKKNSGEIGTHNKFSKDNMMRKLKNKVMESARKLINKMIKIEAGNNFKEFGEMRKIQGMFCQELNIKYNFWFYFQKLNTIFQFKMSTKYSKGEYDSNNHLISKIYSIEYIDKFPKSIKLLDMTFHQYYHDIFLGEKNWIKEFDITEEENKFEIKNFLNNNNNQKAEDYYYTEKMIKLAKKYELFFLNKNPRVYLPKKDDNTSHTREIIKNISAKDYEKYKYYFIIKSIDYLPEIQQSFAQYLNKNKALYENNSQLSFQNEKKEETETKKNIKKNDINNNNSISRNTTEEKISEPNDDIYTNEKSYSVKHNLFDLEKFNVSKKIQKDEIKGEKIENKKINFFINRYQKVRNTKMVNFSKNKKNVKKNNVTKHLFVINKKTCEKSSSLTESNSSSNLEEKL